MAGHAEDQHGDDHGLFVETFAEPCPGRDGDDAGGDNGGAFPAGDDGGGGEVAVEDVVDVHILAEGADGHGAQNEEKRDADQRPERAAGG